MLCGPRETSSTRAVCHGFPRSQCPLDACAAHMSSVATSAPTLVLGSGILRERSFKTNMQSLRQQSKLAAKMDLENAGFATFNAGMRAGWHEEIRSARFRQVRVKRSRNARLGADLASLDFWRCHCFCVFVYPAGRPRGVFCDCRICRGRTLCSFDGRAA